MILLLAAEAALIGSQACAVCHPAVFRAYMQTPMARSSGGVLEDLPAGSFRHDASGVQYRIDGASIVFERSGGIRGRRQAHFFIGSGAAGRSYVLRQDGHLFQAPVTWYAQKQAWDVSPGYEQDLRSRWNRAIEPACLYCHASRPQHIDGTQNRYQSPPFAENGVACERCHGPGALHARGAGPIVNPAKLPPALRDDVCAQCHLTGEARINLPGRQLAMYQAGKLLPDYVSFFVYEGAAGEGLKATSHVEKLSRSLCKQRSGEQLWCGTCHDPHRVPAPDLRAAWYRGKCQGCHQPQACTRGPDCASCHMPRARVTGGGHGVLTDHGIARRPKPESAGRRGRKLLPWPGSRSDPRTLGLAYAELALETRDPFHEQEAFRLLREALPSHSADPDLLTRLGWLHQQRGQTARAVELYQVALKLDPHRTVAKVNLGAMVARQGRLEDAIRLWESALLENPGLTEPALNLVAAWRAQGEEAKARAALQRLLRYDPDQGP